MKIICYLLAIAFSCSLAGCRKIGLPSIENVGFNTASNGLSEVAPPNVVRQLNQNLEKYQPEVFIVSPQLDTTLQDNTVEIVLAVKNYPLFKDEALGMGPHLNLIVDNEHYAEIYDVEQPIVIKDLKPGTHSLRVLAEKPWHESFKNSEAFTYSTFNVLTETKDNIPDSSLPLLTYNQPSGIYNTEPILLDFYLTGIDTKNWQIRATINEESFIIDEWQPIYLQGFQEGNNLIELELLDGDGLAIKNQFNQPIRLITYDAASSNRETLAKLVTDKISFEEAVAITEQNYYIQPVEDTEIIEEPTTEDLSPETPVEDTEIIEEPTTEDLSLETPAVNVIEEGETAEELADTLQEALETPEEANITTISEVDEIKEPETTNILAEDINKDNISTTTVVEKNNLPIEKSSEIETDITETPVPENIRAVEIEDTLIASDEELDTITIEIPKPKLRVPQWWKNFVAYLQERFNNI